MDKAAATRRIIKSRFTLSGWRAVPPGGKAEDTLRMIAEEIAILDGIAAEFPAKAGTLGKLVQGWRQLAEELKMKAD